MNPRSPADLPSGVTGADAPGAAQRAKALVRAEVLRRLAVMTSEERAARSARLLARLTALDAWRRSRCVLLFAPMRVEPDLDQLWTDPARPLRGKVCLYPRVEPGPARRLTLYRVDSLEELRADGPWGLRQPAVGRGPPGDGDPGPAPAPSPDLIVVPGLAFTPAGARLGRGGGYYDRLLAADPVRGVQTIGVAFAFQVLPGEGWPTEPHDIPVDRVASDQPAAGGPPERS